MNRPRWILCERAPRWAPALRVALERAPVRPAPQLREIRRLSELSAELAAHSGSVALVETVPDNLSDVLRLLSRETARSAEHLWIALVDPTLQQQADTRRSVLDAVREAGACECAVSPRDLAPVIQLAATYSAILASAVPSPREMPLEAWAWSRLPWQDA